MSLITKSDIQAIKQFSDNVMLSKIQPFIDEAEELDLKPQLGPALYKALVDGIAASPSVTIYQTLLDGEDYTYCDETITYPGLKKAIAYFAYARYLAESDLISTVTGMARPTPDNSQIASDKSISRRIAQAREAGSHYFDEAHQYLCEKSDTYPLYKGDTGERRRGKVNITHIG